MADVKMVTVDGVRYRPDDAPKQSETEAEPKAVAPKNKARTTTNKGKE